VLDLEAYFIFNFWEKKMMFLITFGVMLAVIAIMAVGVIFGRNAIKGSCGGGKSAAECVCTEKCEKRKKLDAEQAMQSSSQA
jgi:hypothetical protein